MCNYLLDSPRVGVLELDAVRVKPLEGELSLADLLG